MRCGFVRIKNGGYCIMVITSVCGTENSGSIPGSRPSPETVSFCWLFLVTAATVIKLLCSRRESKSAAMLTSELGSRVLRI